MKKLLVLLLVLICVFGIVLFIVVRNLKDVDNGEGKTYVLNAEIVNIDIERQIIYVKDCDDSTHYFEKKSAINCANLSSDKKLIYVNYDTEDLIFIKLHDLEIGDTVIITVREEQLEISENGLIEVEQIQLSTQQNK